MTRTVDGSRNGSATSLHLKLAAAVLAAVCVALGAPAASHAALSTFGSPLSVPATLNTSENLHYEGTNTALPGGNFHTAHDGSDTALWNIAEPGGAPTAPTAGQVVKIGLEGCAQQAAGGPSPLTQIHFQILSPVSGGGAKVELTSQPFTIPVCGQGGASGSTVSTYEPINFCVVPGDYVDFNDEGGYVENVYRSGVPYQVIGATRDATMDSFIMGGGTNNGAVFSPSNVSAADGFASNASEELLLQATLGTGPDARYVCPGGTKEAPPAAPTGAVKLLTQTDGVNHARITQVAIFCRAKPNCSGTAALTATGKPATKYGSAHIDIPSGTTSHVPIRLTPKTFKLLHRRHAGIQATLAVTIGGETSTQTITVKIF